MVVYHLVYEKVPFHHISSELRASCAIREGRIPQRLELSDRRRSDVGWEDIEERIWPVLEGTWAPEESRSGLSNVHAAVRDDTIVE